MQEDKKAFQTLKKNGINDFRTLKSYKLTQLEEFIALGCYNVIFPGQSKSLMHYNVKISNF
jgi:hypothetical protein